MLALFLIIFTFVTLGYFKVDLRDIFDDPAVRSNLAFAWHIFVALIKKIGEIIQVIQPK